MKKLISVALMAIMLFALVPFSVFAESEVWDGSVAEGFASGSGTEEEPYVIMTASELAYFAKTVNDGETYEDMFVKLGADIVLNDTSSEDWMETANAWTPVGRVAGDTEYPFSGSFDGGEHTVSGLYINTTAENQGLFGLVSTDGTYHASVNNIGIINSVVIGGNFVGSVVGNARNTAVSNCYSDATVGGVENVGGIVGYMDDIDITDCYNIGSISGTDCVGGVVGKMFMANGANCYNNGKVTASGNGVGGVFGDFYWGDITGCYNTASVKGNNNVGGVAGRYNMGHTLHAELCYNVGAVSGKEEVGGLFGLFEDAALAKSYNSGAVFGETRVGGIAGKYYDGGAITDCYNNGDVKGNGTVGGIAGEATYLMRAGNMAFENVYNLGNVNGTEIVGGIVGYYGENIPTTNCYYLDGTASVGIGIYKIGMWGSETSELPDSESGITALSDEAMTERDSFAGFDFETVWTMEGYEEYAYPELAENPQVFVPVPEYLLGDVDNNGTIEADDYIALKRIFFGTAKLENLDAPETAFLRCDVDQDGEILADDYILLKRVFFGTAKLSLA